MIEPVGAPDGVTVDSLDWLPSGAGSGLLRVRGRTPGTAPIALPVLVVEHEGRAQRFASLPDPGSGHQRGAWRGAYVVPAALVAAAGDQLVLEWEAGGRIALPAVAIDASAAVPAPAPEAERAGGEVVERAVLAERRARRAEAAEAAQARIAREALRAVEVLELRANEVEDRLATLTAERDALRSRLERAGDAGGEAAAAAAAQLAEAEAREVALRERLAELEAELEARPEPEPPAPEAPPPPEAGGADREAERLRAALTATITTVGELRLRLHEAEVRRRTREVAHGAATVRLTVLEHERTTLAEALAAARGELRATREQREAASAAAERERIRADTAQAAHDDARHEAQAAAADLRAARERIASLQGELAAAREERERALADAVQAEVEQRTAALEQRAAARERDADERARAADERVAQAEAALADLRGRVEQAEAAAARAATARELAEARAVAAASQRRAAEVAHAARVAELEEELRRARAAAPAPPAAAAPAPDDGPFAPPVPPDLVERAAEQVAAAAAAAPAAESERVVADLDAAAEALRRGPTIVPATTEPPARLARGTGGREYPPLRGALVKLAHDDPAAAAQLIEGLVRAQWRAVARPVEYDLTLRELGTLAVSVGETAATVRRVPGPRGRGEAEFHLRADALTVAELLAGVGPRPGRFGRARVSGGRRKLRPLEPVLDTQLGLEEVVRAGAELEPALVLRCLAYAIPPAWTRGHRFTIAQTITGGDRPDTVYLTALDGRGMAVSTHSPPAAPDATVVISREAFQRLMRGEAPPPGERPITRGDHRAAAQLRAWAERVRTGAD